MSDSERGRVGEEDQMISRRELLSAGVASGLAPGHAAEPALEQNQEVVTWLRDISRNISDLDRTMARAWLSNAVVFGTAEKVRQQFEVFFRTHQKFPDFLEIGLAVFMDLYEWHIKNRQQLLISRGTDGRYHMQFMFSTLILRGEHDANYIGIPYDKA